MIAETVVPCECGCGEPVPRRKTKSNRQARFLVGHNSRQQPSLLRSGKPLYAVRENGCWEWLWGTTGVANGGYGLLRVNGRRWKGHQWVYAQAHGETEPRMLDHTCRNRKCVNPEHLRPTTYALNAQNTSARGEHPRGVSFDKSRGRWVAQACLNGRHYFLGRYDTCEEAATTAKLWRIEHMPNSGDTP